MFYFYDVDNGQILSKSCSNGVDTELITAMFEKETLRQLTSQASKSSLFDIAIIGMIILVLLGFFAGWTANGFMT